MTSCNQWNIPKYVLLVCYVKKELCTLFYRLFHLSMLLWKQRASRVNMYLMGDRINCPFRVFIRDLEKTQQQGLLGLFIYNALYVILNIFQNCTVHIL